MQSSLVSEFTLLIGLSVAVIYLFLHLRLSTTLGFLAVGLLAGPSGLGLLQNNQALEEMAEFGVAFLLFSLGLEFSASRLFAMRRIVLGIGGLQMLGTMAIIMGLSWALGPLPWSGSLVCAAALALSSTAMVSQELVRRRELLTRSGMMTMGVLLFQDLVSVFFLAMIPVLASPQQGHLLQLLSSGGLAMALLVGMVLAGRFLFPRLFHAVAEVRSTELFMLTVLLVAMVAALLTERFGLSRGLGAFLAGMLLGESHFRHQIESDIRPFRDVLLGVFFVSVGMMIDLHSIWSGWPYVLGLTMAILLLKAVLVAYLGTLQKERPAVSWRSALALAGTGEFGFALVTLGMVHQLVDARAGSVVLGSLMLGMLAVPPLIALGPRLISLLHKRHPQDLAMEEEESREPGKHIALCGYGRVGQGLGKLFREAGFRVVAMDLDPARVEQAVLLGHKVYYGNCAEPGALARLHLEQAELLVITFDDPPVTLKLLALVRQRHEKLPILVRAADDLHYDQFIAAGATEVIPETLEAGLMLAAQGLALLGWSQERIVNVTRRIRLGRYKLLRGYIPGQSEQFDAEEADERDFIKAVMLSEGSFGVGKRLGAMKLEEEGVAVDAIQRPTVQEELQPNADLVLEAGDVVVLKGKQQALEHCESRLLAP